MSIEIIIHDSQDAIPVDREDEVREIIESALESVEDIGRFDVKYY